LGKKTSKICEITDVKTANTKRNAGKTSLWGRVLTQGYIHLIFINPLNDKLNPICHLLALLGAHHILHVSRIRVKDGILRV